MSALKGVVQVVIAFALFIACDKLSAVLLPSPQLAPRVPRGYHLRLERQAQDIIDRTEAARAAEELKVTCYQFDVASMADEISELRADRRELQRECEQLSASLTRAESELLEAFVKRDRETVPDKSQKSTKPAAKKSKKSAESKEASAESYVIVPPRPELVSVDSATWCDPCRMLRKSLESRGVIIDEKPPTARIYSQYRGGFPWCHYSDGSADAGTRYYNGQCTVGLTVVFNEFE